MKSRIAFFTLTALLALSAAWATLELTEPPGPVLDPDALAYLGAGISAAAGHGFRVPSSTWASADTTAPLSHFPPGFSAAIAVGIKAGFMPINSGRFIVAAGAAASVLFIAFIMAEAGTVIGALTAIALLAASPAMTIVHASILSEPLFLALMLCFIWQLSRTGERSRSWKRTLSLVLLATAATFVRYAGISLVAATVLDTWLGNDNRLFADFTTRLRRAAIAAALPIVALGAWTLSRPHTEDGGSIRSIAIYSDGLGATFTEGAGTLSRWLAPDIDSFAIRAALTVLVIGGLIAVFMNADTERRTTPPRTSFWYTTDLPRALAIASGCYAAVLLASRIFADGAIPFDERMLSPLLTIATLWIAFAMATLWQSARWRSSRRALFAVSVVAVGVWIYGAAMVSAGWALDYRTDGGDLAGREWKLSPLVDWSTHDGASAPLYSNWPAAIWFHTGRPAHELPTDLDSATVTAFREKFTSEHGALLVYAAPSMESAPPDSLAALAGLVVVASWPLGTVWRAPADSARIQP